MCICSSPNEVHSEQGLSRGHGLPGPDCLVPHTHTPVVSAHFSAPHPGGLTEDDGVGPVHLRDLDEGALKTETQNKVSLG